MGVDHQQRLAHDSCNLDGGVVQQLGSTQPAAESMAGGLARATVHHTQHETMTQTAADCEGVQVCVHKLGFQAQIHSCSTTASSNVSQIPAASLTHIRCFSGLLPSTAQNTKVTAGAGGRDAERLLPVVTSPLHTLEKLLRPPAMRLRERPICWKLLLLRTPTGVTERLK